MANFKNFENPILALQAHLGGLLLKILEIWHLGSLVSDLGLLETDLGPLETLV